MPRVLLAPTTPAVLEVETVVLVVRPAVEGVRWRRGAGSVLAAAGLDDATADALDVHLARASATGAAGEVVTVPVVVPGRQVEQVVLLGVGDASDAAWRRAGAALARAASRGDVLVAGAATGAPAVRAFVEGLGLGRYAFRRAPGADGRTVTLLGPAARQRAVDEAETTAAAVRLARDLTNTPSSTKSPQWMVTQARRVARENGLTVSVLGHRQLAVGGFGGLVAVGQGSTRPPRLVELGYVPDGVGVAAARRLPHAVLVGKGITFDTGGLSIKPTASMTSMKTDMAGAGAVLAAMGALRELGVGVRVTGLLALAENMPSGTATRPGDVITQYGGTTVEVLNTDAEGRLVLADALAYAVNRLAPDALVDLATLTGAVSVALGRRDGALYATDERLAAPPDRCSHGHGRAGLADAAGRRLPRRPLLRGRRPRQHREAPRGRRGGRLDPGGAVPA